MFKKFIILAVASTFSASALCEIRTQAMVGKRYSDAKVKIGKDVSLFEIPIEDMYETTLGAHYLSKWGNSSSWSVGPVVGYQVARDPHLAIVNPFNKQTQRAGKVESARNISLGLEALVEHDLGLFNGLANAYGRLRYDFASRGIVELSKDLGSSRKSDGQVQFETSGVTLGVGLDFPITNNFAILTELNLGQTTVKTTNGTAAIAMDEKSETRFEGKNFFTSKEHSYVTRAFLIGLQGTI